MKATFFFICSFLCLSAFAQLNIVPAPSEVIVSTGTAKFNLRLQTIISYNSVSLEKDAQYLAGIFKDKYNISLQLKLQTDNSSSTENQIGVRLDPGVNDADEYYQMNIAANGIKINVRHPKGLFYAAQTLLQILPDSIHQNIITIPLVSITDRPRFKYRGMHLDVARHFYTVQQVKKYIDYLAFHKFNTFHWHLTDDQGWRIQIKKYPILTVTGGCRSQTLVGRFGSDIYDGKIYCASYTQDQIREVVQYAADRHITVIPEIDIPGHSTAALASYPFLGCTKGPFKVSQTWGVHKEILCAGNDSTYQFMQDVLDEVMAMFPSSYIHIGGDEVPKERWKACPVCQSRIKKENLKDEKELQSYFIKRIAKYVNDKGRKIIGWDEILDGGAPAGSTIMVWRGSSFGSTAAKQGHDVIMTPENPFYLNFQQGRNEDSITQGGFNPVEDVYNYDPVPANLTIEESRHILGGQGNVWTEYIPNQSKLEYMIFPRMSALSEALWTPLNKKDWKDFERRLPGILQRYKSWGSNYSNAYFDIQPTVVPHPNGGIGWKLESKNKEGKIIYVLGKERNATFRYNGLIHVRRSGSWGAALVSKDHTFLSNWIWQEFNVNRATGKKITLKDLPNKMYAGSGGFTLVDGIQNKLGMVKSAQFLGFIGKDMEAVIDLISDQLISDITLHAFEQTASGIHRPSSVSFYSSSDGKNYKLLETLKEGIGIKNLVYRIKPGSSARFIKIVAQNHGRIAAGLPSGGSNAWMFVDEIVVN